MDLEMTIAQDVEQAVEAGRPVLALETTVIAHGMPRPRNLEVWRAVEAAARDLGVVPATIGIVRGRIHIGIGEREARILAEGRGIMKVASKDIGFAVSTGADGATTVSATMVLARKTGISVFATGGIGGVHRSGERTLDVSSDLTELGRTPVIVVSAGAKAILDLTKTLEYLETQGVPVVGFRTDDFPAFYTRSSGNRLDLRLDEPAEIARLFTVQRQLGSAQALLVANPVPQEAEIPRTTIQGYIDQAMEELENRRISGKEVTPFLLSRIVELSGGSTLETNIALLANNVRLGSRIALSLSRESKSL
jgi:pseudouridine-5'-phosphate glycosidase